MERPSFVRPSEWKKCRACGGFGKERRYGNGHITYIHEWEMVAGRRQVVRHCEIRREDLQENQS